MIKIVAYVKPHKLEAAKSAVSILGVTGLTVGDARGRGNSEEKSRWIEEEGPVIAFPMRSRLEVVVTDDLQEPVISAIIDAVGSAEPGSGKIFVSKVSEVIRIRTGERGEPGL